MVFGVQKTSELFVIWGKMWVVFAVRINLTTITFVCKKIISKQQASNYDNLVLKQLNALWVDSRLVGRVDFRLHRGSLFLLCRRHFKVTLLSALFFGNSLLLKIGHFVAKQFLSNCANLMLDFAWIRRRSYALVHSMGHWFIFPQIAEI